MTSRPLTTKTLPKLLADLPEWSLSDDQTCICRTFGFRNFHETMAFVNAVAYVAHQQDHHPEMVIGYKTCSVSYTTHSAGGLTSLDFQAARAIDGLYPSEPTND